MKLTIYLPYQAGPNTDVSEMMQAVDSFESTS
jgi:hypothetical protein